MTKFHPERFTLDAVMPLLSDTTQEAERTDIDENEIERDVMHSEVKDLDIDPTLINPNAYHVFDEYLEQMSEFAQGELLELFKEMQSFTYYTFPWLSDDALKLMYMNVNTFFPIDDHFDRHPERKLSVIINVPYSLTLNAMSE